MTHTCPDCTPLCREETAVSDETDALENEPVFICSQLQVGETLTQREVDAIHAILSELEKRENEDVDNFDVGRECGFREIGGEELLTAVKAKDEAYITKVVRETIAKMEARTAEIKAATLPGPAVDTPSPQRGDTTP